MKKEVFACTVILTSYLICHLAGLGNKLPKMDKLVQLVGIVLLFLGRSDRFYKQIWQEVCRVVHLNGKIQNEEGEVWITSLNSHFSL